MREQLSTDPEPEPQPAPESAPNQEQMPERDMISRLSNVSNQLLESDLANGRPTERYIENERGDRLHRSISEGAWRYSLFLRNPANLASERVSWQLGQRTFQHRASDMTATEALDHVESAFAWSGMVQEAEAERVTLRAKAGSALGKLAAALTGRPAVS